jgi:hypothetical protein
MSESSNSEYELNIKVIFSCPTCGYVYVLENIHKVVVISQMFLLTIYSFSVILFNRLNDPAMDQLFRDVEFWIDMLMYV